MGTVGAICFSNTQTISTIGGQIMANTMVILNTGESFTFDAVLSTEHKGTVTVTQHPVQFGASVTDHAINDPDEVMLSIGMTDTMEGVGNNHSVNAFTQLKAIKEARRPVTLVTRLYRYVNMLITSLSAPDDYTTMNGLKANIIFTNIEVVQVGTVTVQETVSASKTTSTTSTAKEKSKAKKSSKKKTTKTTKPANESVLSKISKVSGALLRATKK